ncbi:MAG: hypothetical protein DRJ05_20630, partial [Bacteroidetes bacterium]
TYVLTDTYFSPWVDADLGYAGDDFVGCDVERGLGYCYNGLPKDGGGEPEAYGEQPPAIGVDFFQGPYMDADDCDNPSYKGDGLLGPSIEDCNIVSFHEAEVSLDYGEDDEFEDVFIVRSEAINGVNFGNGIKDDERFGMRRFVYYNNDQNPVNGNPDKATDYYNYLTGVWRNKARMQFGHNGTVGVTGGGGPDCDFMFPGNTDPCDWGTKGIPPNGGYGQGGKYWTEEEVGNNPADRRFMQSAGPFTLQPGAVNYITVGIPWARAVTGGAWASVELLKVVDDKCQALFDNCFKVIDGPTAPDLVFQELDQHLIVYITNPKTSNNFEEGYSEIDPQIKAIRPDSIPLEDWDDTFDFEGYLIYQLADASVTIAESRLNPDKVRLIGQYDIKNGISRLINFEFDQSLEANVPIVQNDYGDFGVVHSFEIFEDQFAEGTKALVNHKQYYFSVMAYAHNCYKEYKQDDVFFMDGQKKPFLGGRKNIKLYTAIPHKTINGLIANSSYGDGPTITRKEGQGNGGLELEFTQETINEILSKKPVGENNKYGDDNYPIAYEPEYKLGKGPVNIKVIDPLKVIAGTFIIKLDTLIDTIVYNVTDDPSVFNDTIAHWETGYWILSDTNGVLIDTSSTFISIQNEQLFLDLGISVSMNQVLAPGPYIIGKDSEAADANSVYKILAENNGLIRSSIEYADSSHRWLGGVSDNDNLFDSRNWIRSGQYSSEFNSDANDWNAPSNPLDPTEKYEKLINGTWAPYAMCAYHGQDNSGPAFGSTSISKTISGGIGDIASVDIVFTSDKANWTRCPVIEMQYDEILAEGGAKRFDLRKSPSVDKDGNPADIGDTIPSDN